MTDSKRKSWLRLHPNGVGTAAAVLATVLLAPTFAAAQSAGPPAGEPAEPNPAEFSELGMRAFEEFQRDNFAAAVALLEEQARRPEGATHVDLALLGTLYLETGRPKEALKAFQVVAETETADPAVLFNAGRAALALGDVETGGDYLERSVAKVPFSPAARELGLLRGAQGRVTEAYRLLRSWVSRNLGDTEARLALAAAGLRIDRAAEIGPLLDGLPDGDPKIALLRAQYRSEMGDPEGAIALLEPLLAEAPAEIEKDVLRLLADSLIDVGRSRDAVALLADRGESDPRLALLLAEGQSKSGDAAAAAATLEPFAEDVLAGDSPLGPVAYQVALDYGRSLAASDRAEQALGYLRRATEMRPNEQLAWKGLGDALMALGRREEATEALARFRELAEGDNRTGRGEQSAARDPGAKAILGAQEAMSKGEHQRALAILRQEIALSPRDLRPRLLEMRLLATVERLPEALKSAEAAVELFPESSDALYMRGVIHMARQSPELAESDFRRALDLAPDHLPAMNDLAVVMTLQGKKDEAKEILERLLDADPDNELALDNLQRMRRGGAG